MSTPLRKEGETLLPMTSKNQGKVKRPGNPWATVRLFALLNTGFWAHIEARIQEETIGVARLLMRMILQNSERSKHIIACNSRLTYIEPYNRWHSIQDELLN